uniref:Immediate early response 2a n=1 Tax=Cyprinus carpio TaxID=7962 RepID=A0A8C1JDZ8_CYPCA
MDITAEAKQVMVHALSKMYSSRTQRGGLRLHRSLLLTLVMRSARDIYHSARLTSEEKGQSDTYGVTENTSQAEEPMDTTSSTTAPPRSAATQATEDGQRKRRSKTDTDPDFLPCKKAKLEFWNNVTADCSSESALFWKFVTNGACSNYRVSLIQDMTRYYNFYEKCD